MEECQRQRILFALSHGKEERVATTQTHHGELRTVSCPNNSVCGALRSRDDGMPPTTKTYLWALGWQNEVES